MNLFNGLIDDCGLIDLPLSNGKFTWSNGRDGVVCSRIDRFLLSQKWVDYFSNPRQALGPKFTSDH